MRSKGTPSTSNSINLTVRFAETDAMGIVHHSNHLIWFEAARVAWLDALAMPYAQMAAAGHHFAVIDVHVRYRSAARFGDIVQVTAWLDELRSRQLAFSYQITRLGEPEILVEGRTEHVCVDLAGKTTSIPPDMMQRLESVWRGSESGRIP